MATIDIGWVVPFLLGFWAFLAFLVMLSLFTMWWKWVWGDHDE